MNNGDISWNIKVSGKESYIFEYPSKIKPTVNDAAIFARNAIFKDEAFIVPDQNPSEENNAQIHLRFLGYEIDSIEPAEAK
jgi:hypothetical protein